MQGRGNRDSVSLASHSSVRKDGHLWKLVPEGHTRLSLNPGACEPRGCVRWVGRERREKAQFKMRF